MGMPFSSKACITPMCAMPDAPPPLSTKPTRCPIAEGDNAVKNRRMKTMERMGDELEQK
jgi:hypothetical protein